MPNAHETDDSAGVPATRYDLVRLFGDIEDSEAAEILALEPTIAELEEAAVWAADEAEALAKGGRPLAGIVAEIVEILTADEEEDELRPAPR